MHSKNRSVSSECIRRNGKLPFGATSWPMAGGQSTPAVCVTQSQRQQWPRSGRPRQLNCAAALAEPAIGGHYAFKMDSMSGSALDEGSLATQSGYQAQMMNAFLRPLKSPS